jgi:dipeptidyl aminopeptidase/acylaminoacyl peptidase
VLLTNTYLPLEGSSAAGLPRSQRPWVVAVEISSGKVTPIRETPAPSTENPLRLTGLEWHIPGRELILRYVNSRSGQAARPERFARVDGKWNGVTDQVAIDAETKSAPVRDFSVGVRQSLNEPPVRVATNAQTGVSVKIWDPNPQLAKVALGEATVYKWKDRSGNEWKGGMVKPPDYVAGRRYPLVIQTHGFNDNEFLTDGPSTTAMAARPMAARGLLVLQVGAIPITFDTPTEVAIMREGLSVIEQLNADGLIDPQLVGIIGFSRTGWCVLDCLLHGSKYFAAATLAEATYISFGEYTLNADYDGAGRAKSIASALGWEPFGEGLQKWISSSAGFNTDKIRAPILFEANRPVGLIYAWDMYALMRLQNKPVDLLYFRNGEHVLTKLPEIFVSQETTVDWYDFWLNGHEDPDPAKAEQYARWRELLKLQQENEKSASQPAVH